MGRADWKLAGYIIEQLLGVGATSEVWRARIAATREPVALKRLHLRSADAVRAAVREAAVLAALDHPYLVRLHDLVPADDTAILVLDLADAGSLRQLLHRRSRLVPGEIITALAPISGALAHAHAHGVMHGDVSAANVLFTAEGRPVLADLGVARLRDDTGPPRCTPAYLDPSVAMGNAPGPESDVFMLGAVAVHAFTGRPLWDGDGPAEMVRSAAAAGPQHIRDRLTAVPPELAALLRRALELEPARRCTAAEFALDLRHSGEPVALAIAAGRRVDSGTVETVGHLAANGRPQNAIARPMRTDRYLGAHRAPGADRPSALHPERAAHPHAPASPGRPAFERPQWEESSISERRGESVQFTHAVRAALRPTLPHRSRARRLLARARQSLEFVHRRSVIAGGACVVGTAALAVMVSTLRHNGQRAPAAADSVATTAQPVMARSFERSTGLASPATVLTQLDSVRAQAFSDNAPQLFHDVYVPGALQNQDVATLTHVVPHGCALVGLHTRYADVRTVERDSRRLVVTASASLSPATLMCGGTKTRTSAAVRTLRLRIELVATKDGYRISSQRAG